MFQKLFWLFTVQINCFSDLKFFANSQLLASNLQNFFSLTRTSFSRCRLEQFSKQNTLFWDYKFGTKTNFWKKPHTNRPGVLVSGLFYHPTYFSFNYKKAAHFFRIMILKKKRNDPNKEF